MDSSAFLSSTDLSFIVKNNSSIKRTIKVFNTGIRYGNTLDLMKIPGVTEEDIRSELTKTYFKALFASGALVIITSTIDFTTFDSTHAAFLATLGLTGFLGGTTSNEPLPITTQTIYVNKGGSDVSGDGRHSSPYKTISYAMSTISDSDTNKRYIVDVGPGEYSDSWNIKPWVAVKGANGASNGATPDGAMLTEITATADTIGFDASWGTTFAVAFMTFLGFTEHQTWDQSTVSNMKPQLNFENCSFNYGATFLGPGNVGFDNVSMQHCISYGGFTMTGWQFLWLKGCILLGGTVTVTAGGASATESTTLLAQSSSIGADYSPTNIVLRWASPSPGSVYAEIDLSNSTTVGDLTLDGVNTQYDCFMGNTAGAITLLNGAATFGGSILGTHIESHGPTPSVLAGAGSGSGASASITSDSDDNSGIITIATGTGASTGALVSLTFGIPWGGEHTPHIVFTRGDANIIGQFYVSSISRTNFTISSSVAPSDAQSYIFYFIVLA